jgi:hypothetical protein
MEPKKCLESGTINVRVASSPLQSQTITLNPNPYSFSANKTLKKKSLFKIGELNRPPKKEKSH